MRKVARQKSKKRVERDQRLNTVPGPQPTSAANELLLLQQTHGNRYVGRMLSHSVTDKPGERLEPDVRTLMESQFGEDFSGVRVHKDSDSQESSQQLDAPAYTVGEDIFFNKEQYRPETDEGRQLLAHELTHTIQQRGSEKPDGSLSVSDPMEGSEREAVHTSKQILTGQQPKVSTTRGIHIACQHPAPAPGASPKAPPAPGTALLKSFAVKFPDAAKLIAKSAAAMYLVGKAEEAGVKFGGYTEEGPGKETGRACTIGNNVYVPKTRTDPVLAMRDFLFELNNGIREPKFKELFKEAAKGTKSKLTAKQFAYKIVELEVEGMLRLGEIWFKMKKTIGKPEWNKYDNDFFLSEYQAFKDGKKTKDDIVKDVLKRVYDSGDLKGKTVEEYYMKHYENLSGGK